MILVLIVLALSVGFYFCYHYINYLLSALIKRVLSCRRVELQDISFRGIGQVRLLFEGYDVEIQNLRWWSNFFSSLETSKLFHLSAGDVRVEKRSKSLITPSTTPQNTSTEFDDTHRGVDGDSSQSSTTKKLAPYLNYLQYVNVRVGAALIVLLDDVPDCLLHVTIEGLNLETFRDREGLQLELQFRLIQTKLFMRTGTMTAKGTSLMELQLAGRVSVDVVAKSGRVKKLGLQLKNTKISVSDSLFDYLLLHPPASTTKRQSITRTSIKKLKKSLLIRCVDVMPTVDVDLDNFVVEFTAFLNAHSTRTLALSLQKIKADFNSLERKGVAKFGDLLINDHQAASQFKCIQFMAAMNRQKNVGTTSGDPIDAFTLDDSNEQNTKFDVEVKLGKPQLELYKHDLEWWMDYFRLQPFEQLLHAFKRPKDPGEVPTSNLADNTKPFLSPTVHLHLELSGFQCVLRLRDGPVIVVGVETAGLKCDHRFQSVELEVESLWCHRASSDFQTGLLSQLTFDQHNWGTTVAIGAGCAQLIRPKPNRLQVYIQVDDCQFEWEAGVMSHLVEYIRLFQKPSTPGKTKSDLPAKPRYTFDEHGERKENVNSSLEIQILLSAKKLSLLFTAKSSAFIVLSMESLRFDWQQRGRGTLRLHITPELVRLGTGELDHRHPLPTSWWDKQIPKRIVVEESGGCAKLSLKLESDPTAHKRHLNVEAADTVELCWSPLGYAVVYEVYSHTKSLLHSFRSPQTSSHSQQPSNQQLLEIRVDSEHTVALAFQLPNKHTMRWITPSVHFEKTATRILLSAPTFLLELDGHDLMILESPSFERQQMSALMDLARQDFKKRACRSNRVWTWSAQQMELKFPYKYDFAAAFDELINAVKWTKQLHGVEKKPFTLDSPLPSDLNIVIKEALLCMNDDPFENRLQLIYEISMDEVFERERRFQMLDQRVEQLKRDEGLAKSKSEALYQSLAKKDAQIYVERINKAKKQAQRHLLSWRLKGFDLKAFADLSLHGKDNVLKCIRAYNPEAPLAADGMEFSTLWARDVVLDVAESRMQFRDYPLPYQHLKDAHFWGTLCGAEHLAGHRSMREAYVELPEPWGTFIIQRNMCPLKFYYDLECETSDLQITYGPCWEPCLSMVSLCWRYINSPSRDPSPPLAFWDKIRLLLHGRLLMSARRLVTSMLASPDPYNDTELIEIAWEQFAFEWLTGEFRICTDLDAYIRTASKYDDSRLLHLPQLKFFVQLNWACLNDQHDHHSVHPIAPNKLPDYVTNGGHDSYRGFRSQHLDLVLQVEVKSHYSSSDAQCPQILFYSNTFKWLDFMKNTLTMVNRPIKRGRIFNEVGVRRQQLSRHFKNIQLNLMLPRFLISYWMSFSSSYGFRMISDSLRLTSSMILHSTGPPLVEGATDPASLRRRSRTVWKISHISVQLENAQVHLYGETRQPSAAHQGFNDSDESFFIGLSRLNYVRESKANKLTVLPKHRRTQSNVGKNANTSRVSNDLNTSTANPPLNTKDVPAVHRLTVHDLRASWTAENRDTCLAIIDGIQKAYLLRKVLSNDAMKMFQFVDLDAQQDAIKNRAAFAERFDMRRESKNSTTGLADDEPPRRVGVSGTITESVDDSEHMLWRLINEAETNLVAYSEETVEPPTNSLLGVALCTTDDVVLTNWQVDLLNSQVVLKGHETDGFILVSAARASITQRYHLPVWKDAQLLLKRSFTSLLSGMQYFAPLSIGPQAGLSTVVPPNADNDSEPKTTNAPPTRHRQFQWLNREIIEEKDPSGPNDKLNNYLSSGDAVGGVVTTTVPDRSSPTSSSSLSSSSSLNHQVQQSRSFQLQRVASRCSCQIFFSYYSDLINMEKFEDFMVPLMGAQAAAPSPPASTHDKSSPYAKREDVDCFTLKHNMLEVCTNSEQYQVILDIVNNLVLFVDPKKKMAQERRRRLWFELVNKSKIEVKSMVQLLQKELRELVAVIRSLERQAFFLNKQIQLTPSDPNLNSANDSLQSEIDEHKRHQIALIDELAQTISVFKEKTVDEQTEKHRNADEEDAQHGDEENTVEIARRFEVCFEDCMWRLTEQDGQISITEVQIRNFLYNRTARIDNSGEHLLEIGTVKVLNLLPNSKYRETLSRLPKLSSDGDQNETDKTPSIRVICRERAPVGGISLKEHFEVNIAPMQAQITYRFFEKMMAFFFPGRNIEDAPSGQQTQNLTVDMAQAPNPDESSQRSLWLSKRFRGAAYNSFRSTKPGQPMEKPSTTAHTAEDEIDKMKKRADKNNMFVYINITSVPFIVSYKGNKDKNIEDVDRIDLTLPQFESHDKNWTWLDLSLEVKRLYRNALLAQFMKQKLLRKAVHERAHSPAANEEEKKRIVLGTPLPPSSVTKKKGKK